jgi:16S rRNA (guanine527-N7)-methyltransferase
MLAPIADRCNLRYRGKTRAKCKQPPHKPQAQGWPPRARLPSPKPEAAPPETQNIAFIPYAKPFGDGVASYQQTTNKTLTDEPTTAAVTPATTLAAEAERQGVELSKKQLERLELYCKLLWEWNEKINLTRHTTYEKFVGRDLLDTRVLAGLIQPGERVLDVGTGGGVPGIPLAILRPDVKVSLSESVGKKARVVDDIVKRMTLHIPVHAGRAEELLKKREFESLVIRAVAPLPKLLTWFKPHWQHIGRLLVIKGPAWVEERGEARHLGLLRTLELRRVANYPLPGADGESVVLQIWPREKKRGK